MAFPEVYVLISRVTDSRLPILPGVPPFDLADDICRAVFAAGFDLDEHWRRAVCVTNEWRYEPCPRLETRATLAQADCNAMRGVLVCGRALLVPF